MKHSAPLKPIKQSMSKNDAHQLVSYANLQVEVHFFIEELDSCVPNCNSKASSLKTIMWSCSEDAGVCFSCVFINSLRINLLLIGLYCQLT